MKEKETVLLAAGVSGGVVGAHISNGSVQTAFLCLTAVCLLPGRAEAGGKPSAGGTDPSAPGGSQSDGQTGPQGGTTISGGTGVLYFKKERDE